MDTHCAASWSWVDLQCPLLLFNNHTILPAHLNPSFVQCRNPPGGVVARVKCALNCRRDITHALDLGCLSCTATCLEWGGEARVVYPV